MYSNVVNLGFKFIYMEKEKSYAASHKGLRNAIAQFALRAGKTDYANVRSVEFLKELGKELFFLLTHHLHTENEDFLQPLERKVPGASQHDLEDHERLEVLQGQIEYALLQLDGSQTDHEGHAFYLAFTDFQSHYLAHILHEELVTEELLLANFSAEELQENSARIMKKVGFDVLLLSLKYIIPAQKETENLLVLRRLKENAPPEAYRQVLEIVQPEMNTEEFEALVYKV